MGTGRMLSAGTALATTAGLLIGVVPATGVAEAAPSPRSIAPIESVGPIATVPGKGPAWPELPAGVAVLPQGSVANGTSPFIYVPDLVSVASIDARIYDITSGRGDAEVVATLTLTKGWGQANATLRDGRQYGVQVKAPSGSWKDVGTFNVTGRTGGLGPSASVGGVNASVVTGETTWNWDSPPMPGPINGVGVSMSWASGIAASAGMPAGWRLLVSSGSAWAGIREGGPDVATLLVPGQPRVTKTAGDTSVDVSIAYPSPAASVASDFVVRMRKGAKGWRTLRNETFDVADGRVSTTVDVRGSGMSFRIGVRGESETLWSPAGRVDVAPRANSAAPKPIAGAGVGSPITTGDEPAVMTLVGWDGALLTFVRNDFGVYEQAGGSRAPGFTNSLTRDAQGNWELIDTKGNATVFVDGRARTVVSKGTTVSTVTWDSQGRVTQVRNEVGRVTTLTYAGAGNCPSADWTGSGYAAPPTGKLCRITYPDATSTDIGYVGGVNGGAQIALLKDAGNQGLGLGWDSLGRLTSTRTSLVMRTATIDPSVAGLVSKIDYDSAGRAYQLTSQPATVGGATTRQTITFPVVDESTLRAWMVSHDDPAAPAAGVVLRAGTYTMQQNFDLDPVAWQPIQASDGTGLKSSIQPDSVNGQIGWSKNPQGLVTRYKYNELGLVTTTTGPSADVNTRAGGDGTVITQAYDTKREAGKDVALSGLRGQVYDRADFGGEATAEFWPSDVSRGGLSGAWNSRPDSFSLQATGVWTPADGVDAKGAKDGWQFSVQASSNATVTVTIAGQVCVPTRDICVIKGLPEGPKPVTVQVSRAASSGWFDVLAAPVGEEPAQIPFDAIAPGYANSTVAQSNDVLPGATDGAETRYGFSDPALGRADSITAPGGLTTNLAFEKQDSAADDWGRLTTRTTPGGAVQRTSYWPATGAVALPPVCGGTYVEVSGQPRTITRQDGTTVTKYFDIGGRLVATETAGGASKQTTCITFADDGTPKVTAIYVPAGDLVERSELEQAVDGDPRVSRLTVTHGPAAPVDPGAVVTSTTTVDLLGRPVSVTDFAGTTTTTQYDALGNVTTSTATPPAGSNAAPLTFTYTYDRQTAQPVTVSVNGTVIATSRYDATTGRLSGLQYADSVAVSYDYAPNGQVGSVSVRTPDARFTRIVQTQNATPYGRVTSSSLAVTGTAGLTQSSTYAFDAAGRLAKSTIATTPTGGTKSTTTYEYGYKQQDSSCGGAYPSAGKDGLRTGGSRDGVAYVTCHDAKGRTTSTTDPLVTGGSGTAEIQHDDLGRVTNISGARAAALEWGADTGIARVTEIGTGSTGLVSTTMSRFSGGVLDKTVTTDAGSQSVRYAGPFILNRADGKVSGTAAIMFGAPGGATVTTAPGAKATLTLPGLDGSALVTVDLPSLATGGGEAPGAAAGLAPRFGPFGEPLQTPSIDNVSAVPSLTWQAAAGLETLPGTSSITLLQARPYHPLLGEFLASDPNFDSGDNLYAYTDGDPINSFDATGRETTETVVGAVGAAVGFLATIGFGILAKRIGGSWGAAAALASVVSALGTGAATFLLVKSQTGDKDLSVLVGLGAFMLSTVGGIAAYNIASRRAPRIAAGRLSVTDVPMPESMKPSALDVLGLRPKTEAAVPTGWGSPTGETIIENTYRANRQTADFGGGGVDTSKAWRIGNSKRAAQKPVQIINTDAQEINLDNYVFGSGGKEFVKGPSRQQAEAIMDMTSPLSLMFSPLKHK